MAELTTTSVETPADVSNGPPFCLRVLAEDIADLQGACSPELLLLMKRAFVEHAVPFNESTWRAGCSTCGGAVLAACNRSWKFKETDDANTSACTKTSI